MTTPPTSAPTANVAQAATAAVARPCPRPPSVSTIEKPHGDHVPVAPASRAVTPSASLEPAQHATFVS